MSDLVAFVNESGTWATDPGQEEPARPSAQTFARNVELLEVTPLAQIQMRSIKWLERPLWQGSAFQLLAGAKGAGKGTYLARLAARISNAGGNVLFVSSEDSVEIDLKPRFVAAGADIARCGVIEAHVELPDHVGDLHRLATGMGGVDLLVIDPVANHIGPRDTNNDAQVRDAIAPLNSLADALECLLIGVRHPGKDRTRGAVASILGSTAWVDTPRAVVMIAVDDEDSQLRHIQVVAGNRSLNGSAQAFRIEAVDVPGLDEPITVAVDLGESGKSVDALLEIRNVPDTKSGKARDLILDVLEERGEQESDALDAHVAQQTGLSARTVRNVRMDLSKEGLVKPAPERDELGTVVRWMIHRTGAPRP
jgi:putative DNA primase/helicase